MSDRIPAPDRAVMRIHALPLTPADRAAIVWWLREVARDLEQGEHPGTTGLFTLGPARPASGPRAR